MNLLQRTILLSSVLVPIAVALPLDVASAASVPPDAVDDAAIVVAGEPTTIDVLANDGDLDGDLDPSSLAVVTAPTFGLASADREAGTITYEPAPAPEPGTEAGDEVAPSAILGTDAFTYGICDLLGQCAEATVSITVVDGLVIALPGDGLIDGPIFLPPIFLPPSELPSPPPVLVPVVEGGPPPLGSVVVGPVVEPPVVEPPVAVPPVVVPPVVDPPVVLPPVVLPAVVPPPVIVSSVVEPPLPKPAVVEPVVEPVVPPVAPTADPVEPPATPVIPAVVPPVVELALQGTGSAVPGGRVEVVGEGCDGGDRVTIAVDGDPVATTAADADGSFSATVAEGPTGIGRHEVTATCGSASVSVPLDTVLTSSDRPGGQTGLVLAFFVLVAVAVVHGRSQSATPRPATPEAIR